MHNPNYSHRWLRPLVDYGPLGAFFIAYYMGDLFIATTSIMVTTLVLLVLSYILERSIPLIPLATATIVGIFGGLTLWLNDETFIKMKPTIIQILFGSILVGGLLTNRLFFKSLMGSAWQMSEEGWRILTVRFSLFFFFSAILNEVIWRTQSTEFWVNFKVFGLMGLTFVFMLSQLRLLKRFALEKNSQADPH